MKLSLRLQIRATVFLEYLRISVYASFKTQVKVIIPDFQLALIEP